MQTLTLDNLPTPVLLVWGLPEDAQNIAIDENYPDRLCFDINIDTITHPDYRLLPEGNWQLIGKLSELTEEQAQTIVFRSRIGKYKDYKPSTVSKEADPAGLINALLEMSKDTALQSFHSAIEAEGYYVENPIPPFHERGKEWQEAESKTLPANALIFKKEA